MRSTRSAIRKFKLTHYLLETQLDLYKNPGEQNYGQLNAGPADAVEDEG